MEPAAGHLSDEGLSQGGNSQRLCVGRAVGSLGKSAALGSVAQQMPLQFPPVADTSQNPLQILTLGSGYWVLPRVTRL